MITVQYVSCSINPSFSLHQAQAILESHAEQRKLEKEDFPGNVFMVAL